MADPKQEDPKQEGGVFSRVLRFLEKQATVIGAAGGIGYASYLALKSQGAEGLAQAFLELGEDLKIELKEQFNALKGALAAGLLVMIGVILGIVHLATLMHDAYIVGNFWHSRVPALFIFMLVGVILATQFAAKWVIPFLAIEGIERFIQKSKFHGEGLTIKALRVVGKLQGWVFFGLLPAIWPPFWHQPVLLWVGVIANTNYVYFTNAWRMGQSENVRRSILWFTALLQLTCIVLVTFPKLYDQLVVINTTPADWTFTILGTIFVQIVVALFLGNRVTHEDRGRAAVAGPIAVIEHARNRDVTLGEIKEANALLPSNQQSTGGVTSNVVFNQHSVPSQSSIWRLLSRALFVGGVIAVGYFALDRYNTYTATTHKSPMVPFEWIPNGGHWPVLVVVGGILLTLAGIVYVLSMLTPGRRR